MSLPDSAANVIRLTEEGYPPLERHITNCRAGGNNIGEREATSMEMDFLPVCKTCRRKMAHMLTPEEQEKKQRDHDAHRVAEEAAGWVHPPPIDERKLRYGSGTEVQGGLPSLGKNQ